MNKSFVKPPESSPTPSSTPRSDTSSASAMLTPSELERLRQSAKTQSDRAREALATKPVK